MVVGLSVVVMVCQDTLKLWRVTGNSACTGDADMRDRVIDWAHLIANAKIIKTIINTLGSRNINLFAANVAVSHQGGVVSCGSWPEVCAILDV